MLVVILIAFREIFGLNKRDCFQIERTNIKEKYAKFYCKVELESIEVKDDRKR